MTKSTNFTLFPQLCSRPPPPKVTLAVGALVLVKEDFELDADAVAPPELVERWGRGADAQRDWRIDSIFTMNALYEFMRSSEVRRRFYPP